MIGRNQIEAETKMDNHAFGRDNADADRMIITLQRINSNQEFVSDKFDNLNTLHRKEITLLGNLTVAYHDKDFKKFTKLLHRTGYKPTTANDQISSKTLLNTLGFRKFKTTRNLLFECDHDKESLFERILQTPGTSNSIFIKLIWEECELWRNSDFLTALNPNGLQPIDFIIKSQDNGNLFAFLVFDFNGEYDSVSQTNKKYFLTLKNEQFKEKMGQSLFQKFYSIQDQKSKQVCLSIIEKLLKEMKQIDDLKEETAIDEVLKIDDEIYKHEILKLLITYWSMDSPDLNHYKAVLSDVSPYFKLFLKLREAHASKFEELFDKYLETLKQKHGDQFESIVQSECNSLLEFALNHGQRKTIDIILNLEIIDANKVSIKSDLSLMESKDAHYFMAKLLENGYYLGNNQVPFDWITPQVLNDFLDSRASENGLFGCQVDYNFLVDPNICDEKMKSDQDNNEKLFFSRGMQPVENILNNEGLKSLITHPVLATFINLKYLKFRKFFYWNFFIFLFFYVVPFYFFSLVQTLSTNVDNYSREKILTIRESPTEIAYFTTGFLYYLYVFIFCFISTIFLTLREIFQLFVLSNSFKDYFKKKANLLEITILILSWTLLTTFFFFTRSFIRGDANELYYLSFFREILPIISAFIVILATIELLSILPYRSLSIYMFMMKQVTYTFVRFFTIFILVIIAFSFCFCLVLKPHNDSLIQRSPWDQLQHDWYRLVTKKANKTQYLSELEEPAMLFFEAMKKVLPGNVNVFTNFENPITSFIKTLQMLSGEYSIDPYIFDTIFKQILFLIFIMTSFVLFNLINGLAIRDISILKEQAEFLNLRQQIRTVSGSERVLNNIYSRIKTNSTKNDKVWWRRFIINLMSFPIRKYPYLHKMNNLSIDFKKKTVQCEQDQKKFHVLQERSGQTKEYVLDEETLKNFNKIMDKHQSQAEYVNEKVDKLQAQMNEFKLSKDEKLEAFQTSVDEIKNLLLQLLSARKI